MDKPWFEGRFEYHNDHENSHKYYEIREQLGSTGCYQFRWGRIGVEGQWRGGKNFREANLKAQEKLAKGYERVYEDGEKYEISEIKKREESLGFDFMAELKGL